jgi:hypothetical protein
MPLDQLADQSRNKNKGLNPRGVDLSRPTNPNNCACKHSPSHVPKTRVNVVTDRDILQAKSP